VFENTELFQANVFYAFCFNALGLAPEAVMKSTNLTAQNKTGVVGHSLRTTSVTVRSPFSSDHVLNLRLFKLFCSTYKRHDGTPNRKKDTTMNNRQQQS